MAAVGHPGWQRRQLLYKDDKGFMLKNSIIIAVKDIRAAVMRYPLVAMLGWQDVRQRYRRSTLGPFWLTISMGVMIGTIGVVFSQIFNTPTQEYYPFLAIGIILWGYMSSIVTDGCVGFISAESIVKQLPLPLFVHIERMLWRNTLILLHNIVIFPLVLYATGNSFGLTTFLVIPGFFLLILNLAWVSLILAVLCSRYRDLPQIVGSILQIIFYLTPIMWMPTLLPDRVGVNILYFNPIFHLLEIVRAPLLGKLPVVDSWIFSIFLAAFGWIVSLLVYGRYKRRIAYWI
jgi:lipopolysaccharide transport system permease protein